MRCVTTISLLLYIVMGGQKKYFKKKSSESLASIHFLLCLDIKSINDPVQELISPSTFFSSTKFILWASKALGQKEMFHSFGFTLKSKRYLSWVHSKSVKSTTCVHFSVVFKTNGCGAVLGFLGIKSIRLNQRFAPCSVALKRATGSYPQP